MLYWHSRIYCERGHFFVAFRTLLAPSSHAFNDVPVPPVPFLLFLVPDDLASVLRYLSCTCDGASNAFLLRCITAVPSASLACNGMSLVLSLFTFCSTTLLPALPACHTGPFALSLFSWCCGRLSIKHWAGMPAVDAARDGTHYLPRDAIFHSYRGTSTGRNRLDTFV